jgi:thiol-disulfide isomerase/thioredoxin
MVRTASTMVGLGATLPRFNLADLNGRMISSDEAITPKGLLVAFLCPHCPFVKHIRNEFARAAHEFRQNGLGVVAVNSNDTTAVPEDGVGGMKDEIREAGYTFPYLVDESQDVARAFRAACTPDFFLFDGAGRLVYRGQFDDSRPKSEIPVTGKDLRAAVTALIAGQTVAAEQRPSIGCNIKWKAGNAPTESSPLAG